MAENRRFLLQQSSVEYCDAERHNNQTNTLALLTTRPTAKAGVPITAFNMVYIHEGTYGDYTVTTGGTSKQEFVADDLNASNDYWNGGILWFNGSGEDNEDEYGFVSDWVDATNMLTFDEKFSATIDTNDDYVISITEVRKVDSNTYSANKPFGMALNATAINGVVDITTQGIVINPAWSWTNEGQYVYTSATAGELTEYPRVDGIAVGRILNGKAIYLDPGLQGLTPVQTYYPEFTNAILYGPSTDPYAIFGASSDGDWGSIGRNYYYFDPTAGYRAATDEYYLTVNLVPPLGFGKLYKYDFEYKTSVEGNYGLRSYLITDQSATKDSGWKCESAGWTDYDSGALNYDVTPGTTQQMSFKFHGSNSADYVQLSRFRLYWR